MKKILIIIALLFVTLVSALFLLNKNKWTEVSQNITKTGYSLFIKYNKDFLSLKKGDGNYSLGYSGGLTLSYIEYKNISIKFSYSFENNGDDTPKPAGDTGAPDWPPQRDQLVQAFDSEKYTYIGTYLGKELYVTEYNKFGSVSVVQKLNDGGVTGAMPLLSTDQEKVNYYDRFIIEADLGTDPKQQKKLYKEFIKILKTLKIEKIEN